MQAWTNQHSRPRISLASELGNFATACVRCQVPLWSTPYSVNTVELGYSLLVKSLSKGGWTDSTQTVTAFCCPEVYRAWKTRPHVVFMCWVQVQKMNGPTHQSSFAYCCCGCLLPTTISYGRVWRCISMSSKQACSNHSENAPCLASTSQGECTVGQGPP